MIRRIPFLPSMLVALACVSALPGCAGGGWAIAETRQPEVDPTLATRPGKAKVCVVRPNAAPSEIHPVRDNGVLVGATGASTRFCYFADPGVHALKIEGSSSEVLSMTMEAGKSYYVREDVDEVMGASVTHPTWIDEADAKPLFAQTRDKVLVSAPAGEALPQPTGAASAAR